MNPAVPPPESLRSPRIIFWTALFVRIAYIAIGHTWRITPFNHHFEFGWETGRVAASLASGHGYASPFSGQTGPTAWMVPGFTLLLAAVFKLFGVYSALSAAVIQAIDSLFQALTVPLVFEIGVRVAGRRTALWSAWMWALYPGIIQYAVKWVWETSLSTLLFAAVIVLGLRMAGIGSPAPTPQRPRDWMIFGVLWGAISMTNPALLPMAPVEGFWILFSLKPRESFLRATGLALLSASMCSVIAAPWVIRNLLVFHAFIPTRSNLGAELAMAWAPDSGGYPWGATIPTLEAATQHKLYAQMGELAYVHMRGEQARQWARAYPARFWKLNLLRFYMFWVNVPHTSGKNQAAEAVREAAQCLTSTTSLLGLALALRRRLPAAWLFFWCTLLLPIPYYFVIAGSRFRHPMEPFYCVLSVWLFQQARGRWGFSVRGLRNLWPAT